MKRVSTSILFSFIQVKLLCIYLEALRFCSHWQRGKGRFGSPKERVACLPTSRVCGRLLPLGLTRNYKSRLLPNRARTSIASGIFSRKVS